MGDLQHFPGLAFFLTGQPGSKSLLPCKFSETTVARLGGLGAQPEKEILQPQGA